VGLVKRCADLSNSIQTLIRLKELKDREIQGLFREVDSLSQVLYSVSTMEELITIDAMRDPGQGEQWNNLSRSMKDCEETLLELAQLLDVLRRSKSGLFGRVKWEAKANDISLLRQEISAYRQTMSLSLQLITVYTPNNDLSNLGHRYFPTLIVLKASPHVLMH